MTSRNRDQTFLSKVNVDFNYNRLKQHGYCLPTRVRIRHYQRDRPAISSKCLGPERLSADILVGGAPESACGSFPRERLQTQIQEEAITQVIWIVNRSNFKLNSYFPSTLQILQA